MARRRQQRSRGQGCLFRRNNRGPWVCRWHAIGGARRERTSGTTDKAMAGQILAKIVADVAAERHGVVDARAKTYATHDCRPLVEHLSDWREAMHGSNCTAKHAGQQHRRATKLAEAMGAARLSDITPGAGQSALATLHKGGLAWKTAGYHLQALKQFTRWARRDGRLREDPLDGMSRPQTATDARRERRALDADELRLLVDAAERGPTWRGLSGPDRAMLYRTAAGTGLRASELASLTPRAFKLDGDAAAVVLAAGHSKRRREDRQPIPASLGDALRSWLRGRRLDAPCWPGRWPKHGAEGVRADLRRARACWIRATADRLERRKRLDSEFLAVTDGANRVADFHALRVTYITLLVKSGASTKVCQTLARHSTPVLTMNTYTRLGVHDLGSALDGLPDLRPTAPEPPERLRATGTTDANPTYSPNSWGAEPCDSLPRNSSNMRDRQETLERGNPLKIGSKRSPLRHNAMVCGKGGDGIRTHEKRICNPLP